MPEPVTMSRILESSKQIVEEQVLPGGTLTSLRKVSFGPLRNPMAYPFVSILPLEERPYEILNGEIDNIRRIKIESWSHKKDSKSSMRSSLGIAEKLKDLFVVNAEKWLVPDPDTGVDMMFDVQIGEISPGSNPMPYRNGFISGASIEVDCFSRDDLHPGINGTSYSQMVQTDSKTLIDTIANTYKNYRTGAENVLASTRSFKSFTLPPQAVYPVIFVGIERESRDHTFVGRDSILRSINVHVLNKLLDKEDALKQNLKIVDLCRRILFANKDFQGRAMHFDYRGIVYGQLTLGSQLLYGSSLNFDIQSFENLPAA